jgi:tRNA dimethylallyltransferase
VWAGTGRGLAEWQAGPRLPPAPWRFRAVLLDPPRPALRAAIAARFAHMLASGAVEEARALLGQNLDPALPAMRAHGVPELAAHLRGAITLEDAAARARAVTGQYTKRQATWFRHHPPAPAERARTINARIESLEQFSHRDMADLFNFVRATG